ncbi:MAG TPA: glycosyltransferase family 4 protein [Puia sp.]|nr:glycosyltransferase family 4 protein [Puia sp.]
MSSPYSSDYRSHRTSDNPALKKVALFTDVDFWAGGAGHRMRIAALISYLSERLKLTVIYTGDIPRPDTSGWCFTFVNVPPGQTDHLDEFLLEVLPDNQFDAAIIEYIHNSYWLASLPEDVRRILDAHDIVSERAQSFAAFDYASALFEIPADLEFELFDQYDHVMALTKQDARKIGAVIGEQKTLLCPHPASTRRHVIRQEVNTLGFIASEYLPNYDALCFFLKDCWPSLRDNDDISLQVYGNVGKWFRDDPPRKRVAFRGFVPDLKGIYNEVDIVINPVRFGAGLKIKNIEAMANGLPLVTTTHGAAGLEAAIGKALLVADSAGDFIAQLHLLIRSYPLRAEMGRNGYLLASTSYSPEICFGPLLKVI